MNSSIYEKKRNELIELMADALAISGIPESQADKIKTSKRKALENQFTIVLVGEFQGGKSTTFNALCDGREISPRGIGIKTSACVMGAMNLSDTDTAESARVTWKSNKELLLTFIDLFETRIRELNPQRFSAEKAPNLSDALHLSNPADRKLLADLLEEQWSVWAKNRGAYEGERQDILRLGTLIVRFYDAPDFQVKSSKQAFSVEEIASLVTFPMDWEGKWKDGFSSPFKVNEYAFAFIGRVEFSVHSKNLARTGSVIVDCPGLFASAWDTQVAQSAMFGADAIWYLFNGQRQMTDGDAKALRFIKDRGWESRLFYSVNSRGNDSHFIKDQILPTNYEKLRNLGYSLSLTDIHLYDALLALKSCQGQGLLEGNLDPQSIAALQKEGKNLAKPTDDPALIWTRAIKKQLTVLDIPEAEDFIGLDADSIQLIRRVSHLDEILDNIETVMIQRKARSILVEQGADQIAESLRGYDSELQAREKQATETHEQFQVQLEQAEKLSGKFKEFCEKQLSNFGGKEVETGLFYDLKENALKPAYETAAANASAEIIQLFGVGSEDFKAWEAITNQDELAKQAESIVVKNMREALEPALVAWMSGIKEGKNEAYNELIVARTARTLNLVKEYWTVLTGENANDALLQNLEIMSVLDTEEILEVCGVDASSSMTGVNTGAYFHYGAYIAGGLAGVAVGLLWQNGAGPVARLATKFIQGTNQENMATQIRESVANSFEKSLNDESFRDSFVLKLQEFRLAAARQIKTGTIGRIEDGLNRRISVIQGDLTKTQRERESIATTCRQIRETAIRPVLDKLTIYKSVVEELILVK